MGTTRSVWIEHSFAVVVVNRVGAPRRRDVNVMGREANPITAAADARASAGRSLLVRIAEHSGDLEPDLEVGVFCQ